MLVAIAIAWPAPAWALSQGRSWRVWHEFRVLTGHPHGWPGHVIDHVIPLACGGDDAVWNMQWQTITEARAKDRWERKECRRR